MKPRPVGKTKNAGWQIGVSRTIAVDIDTAWDFLISDAGIATWLGEGIARPLAVGQSYSTDDGTHGEVRSLRKRDRVRLTWQPAGRSSPATVQIALTPASTGCTFRFHTEHLDDALERDTMRAHWRSIADRIESQLTE